MIDDLLYAPIGQEEIQKTFRELCEAARQRQEEQFKHLRGKLDVRRMGDGYVIVHTDLAKPVPEAFFDFACEL